MLYNLIRSEMHDAMKTGYVKTTSLLKVLLSDIQRDPNKDYSDEKVINVITKTIKNLKTYPLGVEIWEIELLQHFLPLAINEKTLIKELDTIDWISLKNKNQAIGIIMNRYPKGSIDGKMLNKLVQQYKRN